MAISTLARGTLADTNKRKVYASALGNVASIGNAVVCNTTNTDVSVTVWVLNGAGDETMLTKVELKAGVGKSKIVAELIGGIAPQYSVQLQADTAGAIDYTLYGSVSNS